MTNATLKTITVNLINSATALLISVNLLTTTTPLISNVLALLLLPYLNSKSLLLSPL